MYKLLRMATFALPLVVGGAAFAQGPGTSGAAGAPRSQLDKPPVTDDTRTPLQQKAGKLDDQAPAMPGDTAKPGEIPDTAPKSQTQGLPSSGMTTPGSGATDTDVHKNERGPSTADQAGRASGRSTETPRIKRRTDVDHPKTGIEHDNDSRKIDEQNQLEHDQLDSDK